ncbi:MAG: VOC family protein [Myxococcota bacterium]
MSTPHGEDDPWSRHTGLVVDVLKITMPRDFSDQAPPVWVGHVSVPVSSVSTSAPFWRRLGMRQVFVGESVAVLELRGGTHVVLHPADAPIEPGTPAPFDLMVEDLPATRERLAADGFQPTPIAHGRIHDSFTVSDPDGYAVKFSSSHVVGRV